MMLPVNLFPSWYRAVRVNLCASKGFRLESCLLLKVIDLEPSTTLIHLGILQENDDEPLDPNQRGLKQAMILALVLHEM